MNNFNEPALRKGTACIKWDFQEADYGRTGLLPFSIADADYRTYQPIVEALKKRVDSGVIGYTDLNEEYFSAVKGWCLRRHGWTVESSWIVPVGGIVPAMNTAIEVLTEPGAGVIVQPPVYDPFYSIIEAAGRKILKNDLLKTEDGYRMDLEGLEKLAEDGASMLLLCSPHNPVCRVWTYEELQALADICRRYGIIVVSDEIHWDLILGDKPHVTMGSFPELYDRLIVCTSCSKTFNMAGLETSNLIIPGERIREKYQNYLYARYLFVPNTLGLEAVKAAYKDGDEWVDQQCAHLKENARIVKDFLAENLPEVRLADVEGTYLLWLDMTAFGLSSDELVSRIAEAGAGLNSGVHYGEAYDGFVRMNVACPEQQLREGLNCILKALKGA
ncbi:MAG: pyridoxal phosphate-dependent aminotransferase [Lachnospiraceae bacterium]|nr:pyridoxal phosphate-dependent aminotransferase [Lachnospiraceae bacterium]